MLAVYISLYGSGRAQAQKPLDCGLENDHILAWITCGLHKYDWKCLHFPS